MHRRFFSLHQKEMKFLICKSDFIVIFGCWKSPINYTNLSYFHLLIPYLCYQVITFLNSLLAFVKGLALYKNEFSFSICICKTSDNISTVKNLSVIIKDWHSGRDNNKSPACRCVKKIANAFWIMHQYNQIRERIEPKWCKS